MKKPHLAYLYDVVGYFVKKSPCGYSLLKDFTRVGVNELACELNNGRWNNWFFYKNMVRTIEIHYDLLMRLPITVRWATMKQVLSRSKKIWNQKYPKTPLSPLFLVDTAPPAVQN